MSVLTKKIDKMKADLDKKIVKMAKAELDKRFARLKKKYPFVAGVEVVVGMGSWTFRDERPVPVSDEEGYKSTMKTEDFLESAIQELRRRDGWLEVSEMANDPLAEEICDLMGDYEEAAGGDFVI